MIDLISVMFMNKVIPEVVMPSDMLLGHNIKIVEAMPKIKLYGEIAFRRPDDQVNVNVINA